LPFIDGLGQGLDLAVGRQITTLLPLRTVTMVVGVHGQDYQDISWLRFRAIPKRRLGRGYE